jgi:cytochrome b561-like protein/universal stress protein family protein
VFSKVLVPVDGSENSFRALNTAVFLSTKMEAQLTALNVIENPPTVYLQSPTTYLQSPKISTDLLDKNKRESETILEKCKDIASRNGIKIQAVLIEGGDAAPEIIWFANGVAYYTLLFTSGEWTRLVPTSWNVIPDAFNAAMTYATFNFPPPGDPYNPLQQLTYFGVVFLLGPFMIATGAAMSPAIAAQFPSYQKIFRGRQTARSLHFLGLLAFILFIIVHLTMVIVERFPENMGNIVL